MKKGDRSVAEFLAHMKRLCDVLDAFGQGVTEKVQIQVILTSLLMEFESVTSLVTYSPILMSMEQVMDALLECETRQRRFVAKVLLHSNLVQYSSDTPDLVESKEVYDSRMPSGGQSVRG